MAAVTATAATSRTGPWNSQKTTTAPPPPAESSREPATPGTSSSPQQGASRSAGNVPDVVDTDPGPQTDTTPATASVLAPVIATVDVAPDYPMDSMPRPGHRASVQTAQSGSGNPRTTAVENNQTNITVNVVQPVVTVPLPPATMSPHAGGQAPVSSHRPVVLPGQSPQLQEPPGPHPTPPSSDPLQQIRTQDLDVGVVTARLEQQRLSSLPDLLAHSQAGPVVPSSSGPALLPPNHGLPPLSPGEHHRPSEPHTHYRHRTHHDRATRSHRPSGHRTRSRRHSQRQVRPDSPCEETCFKCVAVTTSFRWILVILSLLGVCCVVTGIVLAALHAAGNSFLFLAIMFIGLGVLLVVVVGVGWKCTPRGHEPLHALFGLGDFRRTRSPRRHRNHHRREGRWHGGVMYPEFQFRRPPPSYNVSMQEYQQQLVMAQSQPPLPDSYDPDNLPDEDYSLPSSPPPSYRSRASTVRTGIQITFPPNQGGDYPESRPPTYRSHSSTMPGSSRHPRPSLPRDEDADDSPDIEQAPGDVAFTESVFVDVNGAQARTATGTTTNQNVTVSVPPVTVTVTVTSQSEPRAGTSTGAELPPLPPTKSLEMPNKTSDAALETDSASVKADGGAEDEQPESEDTAL